MKVCTRCHAEKDESEFYIDPRKKTGSDRHRSICKACWCERKKAYCKANKEKISESGKQYYIKNKDMELARKKRWNTENPNRVKERNKQRLNRGHEFLNSMKTPCVKCGETRLHIIHFHHIDPAEKSFNIGVSKASNIDPSFLIPEIKKCVCMCANCHHEFHYFYGYKPSKPVEALKEYLGVDEMSQIGNHPDIEMALATGYPHGEPDYPHCPVCNNECSEIYMDEDGDIFACDCCVKTKSAWEVKECF